MADNFIVFTRMTIIVLLGMIVIFNVEYTFKSEPLLVQCILSRKVSTDADLLETPAPSTPQTPARAMDVLETLQLTNQFVCPLKRRPDPNDLDIVESVWQTNRHPRGDTFVYSAYYDDRPLAGDPTIRVVVMLTYYDHITAFCHLWYPTLEQPYVVRARINETGMNMYVFSRRSYREFTFTCPLDIATPIPTHVSITTEQCDPYTTYVPIGREFRQKPLYDFGMCVANGHGPINEEEMVEWFELHRMLGVSEFNLYDTMYINASRVFDHYKNKGWLRLYGLVHPLNMTEKWYSKVRNLRTVALNDCMLRNMYRYRYLVVVDHDEVIVPRTANNYWQMLEEATTKLNKSRTIHSFSFHNVYFFREFPIDKKKPAFLRTMRYRYRARPNGEFWGSKSILSPLFCFNLMNHYCYVRLPLYHGGVTDFAPPTIAASHHYRACQKNYPCDRYAKEKSVDDVMLRFEKNLTVRVVPVLKRLGLSLE